MWISKYGSDLILIIGSEHQNSELNCDLSYICHVISYVYDTVFNTIATSHMQTVSKIFI